MGDNVFRPEPHLADPFALSIVFSNFMRIYGKGRDNGRAMVLIDEPTEIREDLLRKLCEEKGLSYEDVREALCESLFVDSNCLVEGAKKAIPRLLAEHIKRENEVFRNLIGK